MPSFSADDIHNLHDILLLKGDTGHAVATWIVSRAKKASDDYESVVWAIRGDASPKAATSAQSPASSPVVDPSGERLAFLASRGKGKQVHLLDLRGGEAAPCGNLDDVPGTIEGWSPDGKELLLTVSVPWAEDDLDDVNASKRPLVVRSLPYKLDGSGPIAGHRTHLLAMTIEDGSTRVIVGGDNQVSEAAFSPDGASVAVVRARQGRQRHRRDLYIVDAGSGQERQLTRSLPSLLGIRWSPDGRTIAVAGSEKEGEALTCLWLIDVPSGEHRRATVDEVEVIGSGTVWSADGRRLAVIAEHQGRASIAVIDADTGAHQLYYRGLRQISGLAAHGQGLILVAATMRRPSEIYTCNWDGSNERQRSHFNRWFATRPRPRVSVRRMRVPDGQGGTELIDTWLLKPPHGDGPWPALVYMHGGPESVVPIEHDRQMYWYELCEKGWLIIAPNAVGSSSYGREFANRLRGHWGELDLPQYLAVLETLHDEGLVDGRVGCAGKSYGGFLAAWALGHTDRFTAGIIAAPVANVLSHQGTSDTGFYVTPYALKAEDSEDLDAYRRLSPLVMFENLSAPTLILQGDSDARCPKGQSEELFARAITHSDAEVVMVIYPGGWHTMSASGRPSHRVDYNKRCARWLVDKA